MWMVHYSLDICQEKLSETPLKWLINNQPPKTASNIYTYVQIEGAVG